MPIPDECIASADYDPETLTLTITFQHGGTYSYSPVLPWEYAQLLAGGGRYFNAAIRNSGREGGGITQERVLKTLAVDVVSSLIE